MFCQDITHTISAFFLHTHFNKSGSHPPEAYEPYHVPEPQNPFDNTLDFEQEVNGEKRKISKERSRIDNKQNALGDLHAKLQDQKNILDIKSQTESDKIKVYESLNGEIPCLLELELAREQAQKTNQTKEQVSRKIRQVKEQLDAHNELRIKLEQKEKSLAHAPKAYQAKLNKLREDFRQQILDQVDFEVEESLLDSVIKEAGLMGSALADSTEDFAEGVVEGTTKLAEGLVALDQAAGQYVRDYFSLDSEAVGEHHQKILYTIFQIAEDPTLLYKDIIKESEQGVEHVPKAMGMAVPEIILTLLGGSGSGVGKVGKGGRFTKPGQLGTTPHLLHKKNLHPDLPEGHIEAPRGEWIPDRSSLSNDKSVDILESSSDASSRAKTANDPTADLKIKNQSSLAKEKLDFLDSNSLSKMEALPPDKIEKISKLPPEDAARIATLSKGDLEIILRFPDDALKAFAKTSENHQRKILDLPEWEIQHLELLANENIKSGLPQRKYASLRVLDRVLS